MTAQAAELARDLRDARARTLALVDDLDDSALAVPLLSIVNPPLWELGHVAWFQEFWTLRHLAGRASSIEHADRLYDSAAVYHDSRWDLRLPSRAETGAYMRAVLEAVCARLSRIDVDVRETYFHRLALFHEDMHGEAFVYTRQTLALPPPRRAAQSVTALPSAGACPGDVDIPGGEFALGARRDAPFVFDNEKWEHTVRVEPFRIARAPVTQAEFAEFVAAGGYRRDEWWSAEGRAWRTAVAAEHPIHWRRDAGGRWLRNHFDTAVPLEEHKPVVHIAWHEAQAFCAFAGRRLPTELEWEVAAAGMSAASGDLAAEKRLFAWGDEPPDARRAHLELTHDGPCDVGAFAEGDSAFGCRQMIGNVWEWTASDFLPYPGFTIDPYKEYSQPWFGDHKVLRGGCFATRSRLLRNTWRNFYTPDRRDVFAGFRTCAR
ncbi:MAG: SUMF1/EgtB/PvdO family nonheme iron enzyme [Planctomycetes bacterium]|nr:SUMF1/EgtB/PvdO family nonheme iron enzyme [Planctomycetota bacterium]